MNESKAFVDIKFENRLSEPFIWQNTASVENIGSDIQPIIEDVKRIMCNLYGTNGALYVHGSSVSGGFRPGNSDIDAIWFAFDDLPEDHVDRRREALGMIDLKGVVGYLDVVAMPILDIGDCGRKSQVFACAYNGVKIFGEREPDFQPFLPITKGDYFSCQYSRFNYIIELCQEGYDLDTLEKRSPRSLAKYLARAIFHEAYFRGCPYEQNSASMDATLRHNGFIAEAEEFKHCQDLSQITLNESQKHQIFERARHFAPFFDTIVTQNKSSYGNKVTTWLATLNHKP